MIRTHRRKVGEVRFSGGKKIGDARMRIPEYMPVEQAAVEVKTCDFHMMGCCFDPKKSVDGFFATPCFACKEQ